MFFNNSFYITFTSSHGLLINFFFLTPFFFSSDFFTYQLNFFLSLLNLESSVIFQLVSEFLVVSCPFPNAVNAGYHE